MHHTVTSTVHRRPLADPGWQCKMPNPTCHAYLTLLPSGPPPEPSPLVNRRRLFVHGQPATPTPRTHWTNTQGHGAVVDSMRARRPLAITDPGSLVHTSEAQLQIELSSPAQAVASLLNKAHNACYILRFGAGTQRLQSVPVCAQVRYTSGVDSEGAGDSERVGVRPSICAGDGA